MAIDRGLGQVPDRGGLWDAPSLVWGSFEGGGPAFQAQNAAGTGVLQEVRLLSRGELDSLFRKAPLPPPPFQVGDFCARLGPALADRRKELVETLSLETGFIQADASEVVASTLAYLEELPGRATCPSAPETVRTYACDGSPRGIDVQCSPWGLVAIVLPHNAFLPLAVTCAVSARIAGNAVVLRAPSQSARSAALLASALSSAGLSDSGVSVALASGREFIDALLEANTPSLLHFFGGSQAIGRLLPQCFTAGKSAIFDGQGNVWAYVGRSHPEKTVDMLLSGALRYNGQTCTSINGIVVHPDVYDSVRDRLLSVAQRSEIGPLFDADQAEACVHAVSHSGGRILTGGSCTGSFLAPTLVESPNPDSSLVRDGVFGGVVWIAKGDETEFAHHWPKNRYPLCAAVFEKDCQRKAWLERLSGVARLCINGDPSVEDMFEPWGGYAGSGTSPVQSWVAKYSRPIQIDAPLD